MEKAPREESRLQAPSSQPSADGTPSWQPHVLTGAQLPVFPGAPSPAAPVSDVSTAPLEGTLMLTQKPHPKSQTFSWGSGIQRLAIPPRKLRARPSLSLGKVKLFTTQSYTMLSPPLEMESHSILCFATYLFFVLTGSLSLVHRTFLGIIFLWTHGMTALFT